MALIFLIIAFASAIIRFIVSNKESKDKETIVNLGRRITELNAQHRIEFSREAKELEKEKTVIESRLKGYPNIHNILGLLTIITTGLTLLIYLYNLLNGKV